MDRSSHALCRFVEFPDREVRYEVVTVVELTAAEHDEIHERYQRVVRQNHPPMLELLTELVVDFQRQQTMLAASLRTGVPGPQLTLALRKQAQITAFAATNAVYSFQEHSRVVATRAGGLGLADQVTKEFAAVYAERWPYLLAYKLRKVFTHESLSAISFTTSQREGEAMGTLQIRLDCSAIMDHLGPQVRAALNRQGLGLALDEVLEAAVAGVQQVHRRIRPMLYPQAQGDITALSNWRHHFLQHGAPVSLTKIRDELGTGSRLSYTFIDPAELLRAGMTPPLRN